MAGSYFVLKYLHISCVVLSGAGFVLRGVWMIRGSPLLARRWVRIVPHIVDSVLLASALAVAVTSAQYPLIHGWLTAKVAGLVAYIVLGTIALRRGRTYNIRVAAFGAALLVFIYIVAVAFTKEISPRLY